MAETNPNANRGPWCTECPAEKKTENHWFEAEERDAELVVRRLQLPLRVEAAPLCGEACAQKHIGKWLAAHLLEPRGFHPASLGTKA